MKFSSSRGLENLCHRGSSWWGGTAPGPVSYKVHPQTPWPKEAVPKTQSSPALPGWGCWALPGLEKQGKRRLRNRGTMSSSPRSSRQIYTIQPEGEPLPTDTWGYPEYLRIWSCLGSIPMVPLSPEPFQARGMLVLMAADCSTRGQRSCPPRRCETSLPLAAVMGF